MKKTIKYTAYTNPAEWKYAVEKGNTFPTYCIEKEKPFYTDKIKITVEWSGKEV